GPQMKRNASLCDGVSRRSLCAQGGSVDRLRIELSGPTLLELSRDRNAPGQNRPQSDRAGQRLRRSLPDTLDPMIDTAPGSYKGHSWRADLWRIANFRRAISGLDQSIRCTFERLFSEIHQKVAKDTTHTRPRILRVQLRFVKVAPHSRL